ncbi:hypothetical protein DFH28DRAFT_1121819 [Melampsora americana]|nr:hypothetical protein DFH28DRAFT_1121819 [Melampsora americana]
MPATPMSTPNNLLSRSNPATSTSELQIATIPLTLEAARLILELTIFTKAWSNAIKAVSVVTANGNAARKGFQEMWNQFLTGAVQLTAR